MLWMFVASEGQQIVMNSCPPYDSTPWLINVYSTCPQNVKVNLDFKEEKKRITF